MQFIARQPIFDTDHSVQAYELLFRISEENQYPNGNPDLASQKVIDTAMLAGLDKLADGHSVFLNCTHDFITAGYPTLFPSESTVLEILETAVLDEKLVSSCSRLKEAGYRIALDDFVDEPRYAPLLELADVIKVDFRVTQPKVRATLAQRYARRDRQLLAEKVETHEEFSTAVQQGYTLFQGYFFCRPHILSTPQVSGLDPKHLPILRVLGTPSLDLIQVEKLIKSDPALCYRLLRYLNSPAFYLQTEIKSILHALAMLGDAEVRKWLLLVCAVLGAGAKKPELVTAALVRARFAELLGPYVRLAGSSLFILGLLSLMDAIMDAPLESVLKQVAVPPEVRSALLGEENPFRRCLNLVLAYEAADWTKCDELRKKCHIPAALLSGTYLNAVSWTKVICGDGTVN
jgi:EAL and modified HD-GYP domain-containing signal transduction protein